PDRLAPVVEQLVLHDVGRHVDGVTGPDFLLADLAALGFPLDDPAAAEYEIELLEIGRVLDFHALRPVLRVSVPMMRAEARADLVDVEEELFRGDDPLDLSRFLAQAAYILWLDLVGLDDFQLRHFNLLERTIRVLLLWRTG